MSVEDTASITDTGTIVEPAWRWYPDGTGDGGTLGHALLDVELRLERDAGGVYAAWFTWASGELVALVDVAQA